MQTRRYCSEFLTSSKNLCRHYLAMGTPRRLLEQHEMLCSASQDIGSNMKQSSPFRSNLNAERSSLQRLSEWEEIGSVLAAARKAHQSSDNRSTASAMVLLTGCNRSAGIRQ